MSFRDDLTKEFEQLCSVQLTDKCISHPQAQALKEKKLKEEKEEKEEKDEIIRVFCFFIITIVLTIVIVATGI